jgi:hypothetical protein
MRPRRLLALWVAAAVVVLVAAQLLFSGAKESEVAGNLAFAMLVLGFPSTIAAYPLALEWSVAYKTQGLFPYNSRALLTALWASFFVVGLAQWALITWWLARRNLTAASRPTRARAARAADAER